MNIWWIVFIPLSFIWIGPMAAMKQIGAPLWIFILFALFWSGVALFADRMYDWGTRMGKRHGHFRIVELRERYKPKVLPPARVTLIIIAIISLIFAII
ncbi:MAG: hypothetical protein B6D59_00300 [Campylobacteraceae bacterium 4484_4]|nr:MAG: hypothetical protein B6D59_00300 [Campylobacteraceae bacterium 4484_4]